MDSVILFRDSENFFEMQSIIATGNMWLLKFKLIKIGIVSQSC